MNIALRNARRRQQAPRSIAALEKRMHELILRAPCPYGQIIRRSRVHTAEEAVVAVVAALNNLYEKGGVRGG